MTEQQADWIKERAAIRARLNAATPGPWRDDTDQWSSEVCANGQDGGDVWICQLWGKEEDDFENREANSALIAHAWQDLRTLLSHADQDAVEIERLLAIVFGWNDVWIRISNAVGFESGCVVHGEQEVLGAIATLRAELALREQRISDLREALSRSELGEVWIWSTGDPEDGDNADTITCPILVQAETFREIWNELAALRKANEEVWSKALQIVTAKFDVCDTLNAEAAGPLAQVIKEMEASRVK